MKREYFILLVLCLIVFSIGLGVGIITPFLPSYAKDMGATGFLIGLIFSGIAIVRIGMTPFVGRIADIFKKIKKSYSFWTFCISIRTYYIYICKKSCSSSDCAPVSGDRRILYISNCSCSDRSCCTKRQGRCLFIYLRRFILPGKRTGTFHRRGDSR